MKRGVAIMESGPGCKMQQLYLWDMMKRLGIDPRGGILPRLSLAYATALHRCEACRSKQQCRMWFDATPTDTVLAPHFCPNADILFELQFDQAGSESTRRRSSRGEISHAVV
jgi:Family of unknown function (DUF6455)